MSNMKNKNQIKNYSKKALITCLAAITGCTSGPQTIQAPSVQKEGSYSSERNISSTNKISDEKSTTQTEAPNKYNLPELGSKNDSKKTEPKTDKNSIWQNGAGAPSEQQLIANPRTKGSQDASDFQNMAMGLASSETSSTIKDWFAARHATAEVSIGAGEGGVKTGSFDLLMPVYDTPKDLIFTQTGFRRSNQFTEDYRNTVNLGAGYRHTLDNEKWMFGGNTFYDRDLTGKNDRIGIGAEAWADYVKLAANSYLRLSDWKKSGDLEDYQERPANGWDLRAEAFLPQYPQLGGKVMYEQYYGDEVGLFGYSNRQKDPSAATVGLSYTPIPLISMSTDYRQGQNGMSETSVKLGLNIQIGVPLTKQLSADAVRASHLISNARYDLVDRRNEIVLDYKKNEIGTILIPFTIKSSANTLLSFPVSLSGKVQNISWSGTGSPYVLPYGGGPTGSIKLPAYNPTGTNVYTLQAIGTDSFGRVIQSNLMQITVESVQISIVSSKQAGTAMANGTDSVVFTATLKQSTGEALPNTNVVWDVQGNATISSQENKTDASGNARLALVSKYANLVKVSVSEEKGAKKESDISFTADSTTAEVTEILPTGNAVADGVTPVSLVATVADANGNIVPQGTVVTWTTTSGTLGSTTSQTDEQGKAVNTIINTSAVQTTITARSVAGAARNRLISFTSNLSSAHVSSVVATPSTVVANGVAESNLVATVIDSNGNKVPAGVTINWTTTGGTLGSPTSTTDAQGKATNTLKSSTPVSASVTAGTTAGSSVVNVNFTSDSTTAKVINVLSSVSTLPANGISSATLTASVVDASGNIVPVGTLVNWSTTNGSLSSATSVTDAQGKATATLTGTTPGQATITASSVAGNSTTNVNFIVDNTNATVSSVTSSLPSILANGITTVTLTAIVKDTNGNSVGADTSVSWTTTSGTLSSPSTMTDSNGHTTVILTSSTVAGINTITASAAKGSSTVNVEFLYDSSSIHITGMTSTPETVADGTTKSVVSVNVIDSNGPVKNATVTWTRDGTQVGTSVTDNNGKAIFEITSTVSGNVSIQASTASATDSTDVKFIGNAATATIQVGPDSPTPIVADGVSTKNIIAYVEDANHNILPAGQKVNWTTSSGTLSAISSLTDANGIATVTIKNTEPNPTTITGTLLNGQSSNTFVSFTPDTTKNQVDSINLNPKDETSVVVGTPVPVGAIVKDLSGNNVGSGITVHWTTSSGSFSSATTVTDNNGATTNTLTNTTAGIVTVGASAGNGVVKQRTITFTADSSTAKFSGITQSKGSTLADAEDINVVTVKLVDAYNNPIKNSNIHFEMTNGGFIDFRDITADVLTDNNGEVKINTVGFDVGTGVLTATANGSSVNTTLNFTAPEKSQNYRITNITTLSSANFIYNQTGQISVSIGFIVGPNGPSGPDSPENPDLDGYRVTLECVSSVSDCTRPDGSPVISNPVGYTNFGGRTTFDVRTDKIITLDFVAKTDQGRRSDVLTIRFMPEPN